MKFVVHNHRCFAVSARGIYPYYSGWDWGVPPEIQRTTVSLCPSSGAWEKIRTAETTLPVTTFQNPTGSTSTTVFDGAVDANTTRQTTDTSIVRNEPLRYDDLDAELARVHSVPGSEGIREFLNRPYRIAAGSFAQTDALGWYTGLMYSMPSTVFSNNILVSRKLANVSLIRADMTFTLNVNATRFQQGRYMLVWLPMGGMANPIGTSNITAFQRMHAYCRTTITQLPHVEIDLSQQTTVQLKVPFSSADTFYQLNGQSVPFDLGYIFLACYSPLVAGSGSTTADWSMFVSFDNVSLSGVSAQSGFKVLREQKQLGIAPLSGGLGQVSAGLSTLSSVPFIGSFASTASWVTDYMSKTAKVFGFAKPPVLNAPSRVSRRANVYDCNGDGAIDAQPLGVFSNNEVALRPGLGVTTLDEMSYDFIKSQYAYYSTAVWASTDSVSSVVLSIEHNPYNMFTTISPGLVQAPVAALAWQHQYWRGSMKFRIKIVKTEFHSGRLIVAYAPWEARLSSPSFTMDQSDVLWREIIDIRQTSEFEVCVPYVNGSPWRKAETAESVGVLRIFVLDRLQAPNTVSSSVTLLVEACGGEDMEFAYPRSKDISPYIPLAIVNQSGYKAIECDDLGTTPGISVAPSLMTIGEKLVSLRSILKATAPLLTIDPTQNFAKVALNTVPRIAAFVYTVKRQTAGVAPYFTGGNPLYKPDRISVWGPCYLYQTGSMRVLVSTDAPHNFLGALTFVDSGVTDIRQDFSAGYPHLNIGSSSHLGSKTIDGDVNDFLVPCYNAKLARVSPAHTVAPGLPQPDQVAFGSSVCLVILPVVPGDVQPFSVNVGRSGGDDFSLSGWIGTVPMIASGTL